MPNECLASASATRLYECAKWLMSWIVPLYVALRLPHPLVIPWAITQVLTALASNHPVRHGPWSSPLLTHWTPSLLTQMSLSRVCQQFPLTVSSSTAFGPLALHCALRQVCPPRYRVRWLVHEGMKSAAGRSYPVTWLSCRTWKRESRRDGWETTSNRS
jgi:hypothetical protein